VVKSGQDTLVTDEAIKRRNMDPVEKGLRKLVNSQGKAIDGSVISLIASAVTATSCRDGRVDRRFGHHPARHPQGQGVDHGAEPRLRAERAAGGRPDGAYLASDAGRRGCDGS
jgi:hypothetical protein